MFCVLFFIYASTITLHGPTHAHDDDNKDDSFGLMGIIISEEWIVSGKMLFWSVVVNVLLLPYRLRVSSFLKAHQHIIIGINRRVCSLVAAVRQEVACLLSMCVRLSFCQQFDHFSATIDKLREYGNISARCCYSSPKNNYVCYEHWAVTSGVFFNLETLKPSSSAFDVRPEWPAGCSLAVSLTLFITHLRLG